MFRSELLGKMDNNIRGSNKVNPYSKESANSPPASSSSSDNGSPPFIVSADFNNIENSREFEKLNREVEKLNDATKPEGYWEKRRKNNEAARRSRNVRKQKEHETAVRAEFLEKENEKLKMKLSLMTSHVVSCNCQPHATNQLKMCLHNNQLL